MQREGNIRRPRSDKKVDCKPTIPLIEKDRLYEIAWWAFVPVKDAAELLTMHILRGTEIIEQLSKYFVRPVRIGDTLYNGSSTNPRLKPYRNGKNERITIKFKQNDYNHIAALAYALGCSHSAVVAWAIHYALEREYIVRWYIETHSAKPIATRAASIEIWFSKNYLKF